MGFFNSEKRDFSPAPIGYASLDYETAINAMKTRARELGYNVAPIGEVETKVIAITPEEDIKTSIDAMLDAVNDWLQTADKSCQNCASISGIRISDVEDYKDWDSKDKIVFVWGLETLSPNSLGLRSGLGAFIFDANGLYQNHIFKEYNFTNYTTEPLIADLEFIAEEIARIAK